MSRGKYWFPAKTYGWGWGPPATWQGWLTLAIYFGLVVAGVVWFPPQRSMSDFAIWNAILTAALIGVCRLKGEPPRWRWGPEDRDER